MSIELVPVPQETTVTVRSELHHSCPFVDEGDVGEVEITWTARTSTIELHSLSAYLVQFAHVAVSHEALTARIQADLLAAGVEVQRVRTFWRTAGMAVTVEAESVVLRESVRS